MRFLITSGGSREPIDDVRYVGNASSGRTGAWLAEELVRRFHTVHLLSGTGAILPEQWCADTGLLVQETYGSARDLLERARRQVRTHSIDAMLFVAAVADFEPRYQPGKVSSDRSKLVIEMTPTPKVVDALRLESPETSFVTFKLESVADESVLLESARRSMERVQGRFVVANGAPGMGRIDHPAWLLGSRGEQWQVDDRHQLVVKLCDVLEEDLGEDTDERS